MGAAWERHAMCESALNSTAWQGNGMGAAWARHAMCESALTQRHSITSRKTVSSTESPRKQKRRNVHNRKLKFACHVFIYEN
jgi:hypothetical protein